MTISPAPKITLNDGLDLPRLGLGTYALRGVDGARQMAAAIDTGYRLLDSAVNYENEAALGQAVRASSIPREELVLTTKLPGRHHGHDNVIWSMQESLWTAGLDYWDLVLVHWPNPNQGRYVEAVAALLELRDQGLIRSVGVSNFLPEHLDALKTELDFVPSINQIQMHPYWPQNDQLAANKERGIVAQSWSPLGRRLAAVDNPAVRAIAQEIDVTPAQIVLAWHIQRGAVPLPKSADPQRQKTNLDVFGIELSADQVARIDGLARPDGSMGDFDPATHEEF
ncbi:MAG: aldo/keto reductase [Actinomycetaceae bacterium]|nr:aldo/keto reductase [Actinomycetaceae bacterium]